ncbi:MAG TPA: Calx-beta domain-containing protein [Thermoanaerobaculaceae bacterium]|nr:Calx-beta domain-containing protein [Thermoanaerobaculaceae bacterium]HPS77922.1 Calx-beta domain-containing protein [Thermoanaerobaculaceae bacterium]
MNPAMSPRLWSCFALASALAVGPATAQEPHLVADLNSAPVTRDIPLPAFPRAASTGSYAVFVARGASGIDELWRTDGTPAGTTLLRDIAAGGACAEILGMTAFGDQVLVAAATCRREQGIREGTALWRTDGTPEGTVLVAHPNAAYPPNGVMDIMVANDRAYFTAMVFPTGWATWRTGGKPENTREVAHGVAWGNGVEVGGRVLFPWSTGSTWKPVLWTTNAGLTGAAPFRLPGGELVTNPEQLLRVGARLFLQATDITGRSQLWVTDGSPSGTVRLGDLSSSRLAPELRAVEGGVLAAVWKGDDRTDLWASDGSPAATHRLRTFVDVSLRHGYELQPTPRRWTVFTADDGVHGSEPWRSDGTLAGTFRLADVCPGDCGSWITTQASSRRRVVFVAAGQDSRQVWATAGTAASTVPLGIAGCGNEIQGRYDVILAIDDRFLLTARDTEGTCSWWTSDGTPSGTQPLLDPRPGTAGLPYEGSHERWYGDRGALAVVDGTAALTAGGTLWRSDGSATGTGVVTEGLAPLRSLVPWLDEVLFTTADTPQPLFSSNLTPEGTSVMIPETCSSFLDAPAEAVAIRGVIFAGRDHDHGCEPWITDASGHNPHLLSDLEAGPASSLLRGFVPVGDSVFFTAGEGDLYSTDGLGEGTRLLGRELGPSRLTKTGSGLGFVSNVNHSGFSDGTSAGTRIFSPPSSSIASWATPPVQLGGGWLFGQSYQDGWSLWRSASPDAEPVLLSERRFPVGNHVAIDGLTVVGPHLLFVADDGTHGVELWRTDGTADGTTMVRDINPGVAGSNPGYLVDAYSTLYFAASDGLHGVELWRSDGTSEGTVMVSDVNPGPASSNPTDLALAGNQVFFLADDGVHGTELWAARVTPLPELSVGDAQVVPHPSAPTPVEVPVTLSETSGVPVHVSYRTVEASAVAGADFTPSEGELIFEPGETGPKPIVLLVSPRAADQPALEFHVVLVAARGAVLRRDSGRVTILPPDAPSAQARQRHSESR